MGKTIKSISQKEIAREISVELNMSAEIISRIIDLEQRKTMEYCKKGFKVIKKNYLTLTPINKPEKTVFSYITNKEYKVIAKTVVKVTVGEGFKSFVNDNLPMKDKLCRFVGKSSKKGEKSK